MHSYGIAVTEREKFTVFIDAYSAKTALARIKGAFTWT
jgi:hypothetical protein